MPVEGLAGNAEFGAEVADFGVGLAHGRHGEPEFRGGHFVGASAVAAAGAGGGEACEGAFRDEFAFEFCEGGEDSENELSGGGGGVDGRALAGEHLEPDAAFGEVVDDVDEVAEVPAEPVEFPYDQGVFVAEGFEAGGQLGPVVLVSGGPIFVEGVRADAGGQEWL